MKNENLRRRTDEKSIGFADVASDAYPYMRFKEPVFIVAFVVIEDFPVTVIARRQSESEYLVHWYGFHKGQWYTDFISLTIHAGVPFEQQLQEASDILLDQASDTYQNDIKEPTV